MSKPTGVIHSWRSSDGIIYTQFWEKAPNNLWYLILYTYTENGKIRNVTFPQDQIANSLEEITSWVSSGNNPTAYWCSKDELREKVVEYLL